MDISDWYFRQAESLYHKGVSMGAPAATGLRYLDDGHSPLEQQVGKLLVTLSDAMFGIKMNAELMYHRFR